MKPRRWAARSRRGSEWVSCVLDSGGIYHQAAKLPHSSSAGWFEVAMIVPGKARGHLAAYTFSSHSSKLRTQSYFVVPMVCSASLSLASWLSTKLYNYFLKRYLHTALVIVTEPRLCCERAFRFRGRIGFHAANCTAGKLSLAGLRLGCLELETRDANSCNEV